MTATPLNVLNTDTKPWYKYVWPWVCIGISTLTLVVSFSFAWLAVHNSDSEVRDDWYKDGKAINMELARDDYATALSIGATIQFDHNTVIVDITGRYAIPAEALPSELSLGFSHPTVAGKDVNLVLKKQAGNRYQSELTGNLAGRYYVELGGKLWRLRGEAALPQTSLNLTAQAPHD